MLMFREFTVKEDPLYLTSDVHATANKHLQTLQLLVESIDSILIAFHGERLSAATEFPYFKAASWTSGELEEFQRCFSL